MANDIKKLFLRCYDKLFKKYFGYEYSKKREQNIKIGKVTLEDLGILENINELFEEVSKGSNGK